MFKQALLVFAFLYLLEQLFVALFMDLVNDLTKHILIIRSVKVDTLGEPVSHLAVDKAGHKRIRQLGPLNLCGFCLVWCLEVDGIGGEVRYRGRSVNIGTHVHILAVRG